MPVMTAALVHFPALFDPAPVIAVQRFLGYGWPGPWVAVSALGIDWGIILAIGVALWFWGRRVAYGVLAVAVVEGLTKTGVSTLLDVPRPHAAGIVRYERIEVPSFPSGHVSTAAALWSWLALERRVSWAVPAVIAAVVALARLYLGAHYLGDVVGALLLVVPVLFVVRRIWPPFRGWLEARPFGLLAGVAAVAVLAVAAGALFLFGSDPYRWRSGGLVAGLALGLPLEYRLLRYQPGEASRGRKAAMLAIGAAGIGALAAIDEATGRSSNGLGLGLTALAALWAVLGAPGLFVLLGWSRRGAGGVSAEERHGDVSAAFEP